MFGAKLQTQTRRKKKHGLAFIIISIFTLAIEMMLGINAAFLVDQSVQIVADNMLGATFLAGLAAIIALVISLAVGSALILGGQWTFSGFLDSLDDARAYQDEYKTAWPWPEISQWGLVALIVGVDFTTLFFRAAYFAAKGEQALFWFFVLLIFAPFLLGAIVHVIENTPHDRRVVKVARQASAIETDRLEHAVQSMDDDLRSRWVNASNQDERNQVMDEHYSRTSSYHDSTQQIEAGKSQEVQKGRNRRQHPFIQAVPTQADGNGHKSA